MSVFFLDFLIKFKDLKMRFDVYYSSYKDISELIVDFDIVLMDKEPKSYTISIFILLLLFNLLKYYYPYTILPIILYQLSFLNDFLHIFIIDISLKLLEISIKISPSYIYYYFTH